MLNILKKKKRTNHETYYIYSQLSTQARKQNFLEGMGKAGHDK